MAVAQLRTCDLCGATIPPEDVVGTLFLPGGTPEEIHQRIQAEIEKLNPIILMTQPNVAQEISRRHHGTKWDVCKGCVESLTKWTAQRFLKWAALGYQRTPGGSE